MLRLTAQTWPIFRSLQQSASVILPSPTHLTATLSCGLNLEKSGPQNPASMEGMLSLFFQDPRVKSSIPPRKGMRSMMMRKMRNNKKVNVLEFIIYCIKKNN